MHTRLDCSRCARRHAADRLQNLCEACGKPLLARYALDAIAPSFTPATLDPAALGMWRFAPVLPVDRADEAVTLGEGATPLLRAERRGPFAPFEHLFVKDESANPTGSFKARGVAAAMTRAAALGVETVALPSAGNAGGAAASYAARAGIRCVLFVPRDTPAANVVEAVTAGAEVHLVDGLITDCGALVRAGCERFGWFDLSTLKEPFRIEGKKTMGYELALDLGGAGGPSLPDVVLYPTGGGTGLIGMWKAFDEMEALGWIGPARPRVVVVQAEGCCPIVRAFETGRATAEPFAGAATVASGLRVPAAIGDFLMLEVLRASGGTAVSVSDAALLEGARALARHQGIFACPEGGAVWAAAETLRASGWIEAGERVVLFNTGTGLKYAEAFEVPELPVIDPHDSEAIAGFER